jgi:transcriptional regulator with AAA-type ATPase domain
MCISLLGNVREFQNLIKRIIFSEDTAKNISDLIGISKVGYENAFDEKAKKWVCRPIAFLIILTFMLPNSRHCLLKKNGKKWWIWLKKN